MTWLSRDEFNAYYRTPTWLGIRRQALKYHGWRCKVCGARRRLEVNHIDYTRWGGNEKMTDLMILCRKHHQSVTEYVWAHKDEAEKLYGKKAAMSHATWWWYHEVKRGVIPM
jgi:5-methylcytosine-specific restriction endonuclease McrA